MSEQGGTTLTKTQAKERLAQVVKQAREAQAARIATAEQRYEEAARPAWRPIHQGVQDPVGAECEAIARRCEAIANDAQATCDETVAIAEASRAVLFAAPDPRRRWWKALLTAGRGHSDGSR